MTQADSVLSTPPTNTPVDTTRRRFITIAAGASIVSVGSLVAAAATPNATPEVSSAPVDPIYAAIEAHREAYATMQAVFAEHRRAHELADAQVGPADLDIPSMVEPGETVEACCRWDIERAVPREQFPELNAHHNRLLDERKV